jgi:hypothetical protein
MRENAPMFLLGQKVLQGIGESYGVALPIKKAHDQSRTWQARSITIVEVPASGVIDYFGKNLNIEYNIFLHGCGQYPHMNWTYGIASC